jgi:hypothetical protein
MAKNNEPQTLPEYIKWLKKAESKPHLYDNDEYIRIKKELYQAKKLRKLLSDEEKSYTGFGYQRKPMPPVEVVDTTETEVVESVDVEIMEDANEV